MHVLLRVGHITYKIKLMGIVQPEGEGLHSLTCMHIYRLISYTCCTAGYNGSFACVYSQTDASALMVQAAKKYTNAYTCLRTSSLM